MGSRFVSIIVVIVIALAVMPFPGAWGQGQVSNQFYGYSVLQEYVARFTLVDGTTTLPNGTAVRATYFDVEPFAGWGSELPFRLYPGNFTFNASSDYVSPPNSLELRYISIPPLFKLHLMLKNTWLPPPSDGTVYGATFYVKVAEVARAQWASDLQPINFGLYIWSNSSYSDRSKPADLTAIGGVEIKSSEGWVVMYFWNILSNPNKFGAPYSPVFKDYVNVSIPTGWLRITFLVIVNASIGKSLAVVEVNGKPLTIWILNGYQPWSVAQDPPRGIGLNIESYASPLFENVNTTIRIDDFSILYGRGWFSLESLLSPTTTTTTYYQPPYPTTTTTTTTSLPEVYFITITKTATEIRTVVNYITVTNVAYMPGSMGTTVTVTTTVKEPVMVTYERRITEALSTTTQTIMRLITITSIAQQTGYGITDQGLIIASAITAIAIIAATLTRRRK
jgi:hypothetical protein